MMWKLGDGTCIIEITHTEFGGSDLWSPHDLKRVAYRLIRKCMLGGKDEGGVAYRLGQTPSC